VSKIFFAIGIHNHQPIGNFEFVFDEAYRKAYRPFVELLKDHTNIRVGLHYSGILLEWLDAAYPEFLDDVNELVQRGQVELIGGAYYEPILTMIPPRDILGQIDKLKSYLQDRFNVRPRGAWTAERVWEPHLPAVLHDAGIEYTILDDVHFRYAGLKQSELNGYYRTEEDGRPVNLFPIHKELRYLIPFQKPQKTIDYLLRLGEEDRDVLAVFADDGEKFGIWPKTYDHVYTDGWLAEFFSLLGKRSDSIELIHFSEAIDRFRPQGLVYLPTASYTEMGHWALPADDYARYEQLTRSITDSGDQALIKGGFWRNFFVKYPEANHMHKRMLRLSRRIARLGAEDRPEEQRDMIREAENHLWAGQCNCPYWHGVFGGLYLNNLRYRIYKELLLAEKMADVVEFGDRQDACRIEEIDFDCDGQSEILVETARTNVYFDRHGHVLELDCKDVPMNVTDVLTRCREGYHQQLIEQRESKEQKDSEEIESIHDRITSKEKGLESRLHYDRRRRVSYRELWFDRDIDLEEMANGQAESDTAIDSVFTNRSTSRSIDVAWTSRLAADGHDIQCEKRFLLMPDGELQLRCAVTNRGTRTASGRLGLEMNFTLLAGAADDRYYVIDGMKPPEPQLNSYGESEHSTTVALIDEWQRLQIGLRFDRPATVWRYPVETISLSEEGFERVYQGSCLLPFWTLALKPGETWHVEIKTLMTRNIFYTTGGQHET
jgi:alpha-amylase